MDLTGDDKKVVAVTGEGFADVAALKAANVGFSMGSGVPAAKSASKMILINDDVSSMINAVLWGRNIYCNVRRFLQFQIIFNVSTVLIVFIGAIFRGATLFSVIHLLWMNMIMDTLAAIALAAERPEPEAIKEKPVSEDDNLITSYMWKQITGMTVYISAVMFIMFWFNEDFWGFTYGMEDDMFRKGQPTGKCQAFTMLFNLFIWLHIFNLLACRDIDEAKFRPFRSLLKNWLFLAVLASIIGFQYVMVEYGGVLARTSGLTSQQHAFSVLIGSTSLIVSNVIKKLPHQISKFLDLGFQDKHIKPEDGNKLMALYDKVSNIQADDIVKKRDKKDDKEKAKNVVVDVYQRDEEQQDE
jgi:magnesium-transporting ATPase (P-type)